MGGKVAKKLGDGLMALFGYPVAQENDAERAVRAALSIQRALAKLNRRNEGAGRPALAARVAIDTGPAVLDAAGEIFGDVTNIRPTKISSGAGGRCCIGASPRSCTTASLTLWRLSPKYWLITSRRPV
jgi:class 3 adenylate cyclase